MRSIVRAGLCFAFLAFVGLAVSSPAAASPPKLTVTGVFDKPSYVTGDKISVEFAVHNSGTTAATDITAQDGSGPDELALAGDGFGELADGATIPAGGTVKVTVTGYVQNLTATKVVLSGDLYGRDGNGVAYFSFSAPVTVRTATASGLVFGDANANGRADPGEGVSGVNLRFFYQYASKRYTATTDSSGRFDVVLPTTSYSVSGAGSGWTVIPQPVTVGAGGTDLSLRAVRPLGNVLTAELHFTQHTYAPGDTVHLVVTLTNTGSATLRGIGAECNHVGDADELNNAGPGWGELAYTSSGVTLLAHQTRTFDVTDKVPAGAQRFGQVVAACDFGYPEVYEGHRPEASDAARVPGQFGALAGDVQYYPHGHGGAAVGLANVRVVLVDPTTCPVITRSVTTDGDGHFRIGHAPAGSSYKLYFFPPTGWKVRFGNPTNAFVLGNDTTHISVEVEHGSATVPSIPTTCRSSSAPTPPPTGIPIANTGTDSAQLASVGGAAIGLGVLLTAFGGRRRRAH
jgi:hypothetical protein